MPDIFVPFDTNYYSDYYRDLIRKGILNQFVLEYVDNNRSRLLKDYLNFDSFKEQYSVDAKLFEKFLVYAEENNLPRNGEALETSGEQIRLMLKAFIARDIFGRSEFFEIFNNSNATYLKAMEVLENWDRFQEEVFK